MRLTRISSAWRNRLIVVMVLGVLLVGFCGYCLVSKAQRRKHIREVDERIAQEVEQFLIQKLRDLPDDSEITQRYGKFQRLSEVRYNRPNYFGMLIVRLDFTAVAHFEKAQARVGLGIISSSTGPAESYADADADADETDPDADEIGVVPDEWSPSEINLRLVMVPSAEQMREHPERVRELKVIDGEMWVVTDRGRTLCTFDGWVGHPDFLNE
jgi:hypothetical protein